MLRPEGYTEAASQVWESIDRRIGFPLFIGFAGLNNSNGRGSMDAFWAVSGINFGGGG